MTITMKSRVRASRDQVSAEVRGEAVILQFARGTYFGLDEVGARIWQLVQAPTTVEAVRDAIVAEYDVEPERCARDLTNLLERLLIEGLLDVDVRDAP